MITKSIPGDSWPARDGYFGALILNKTDQIWFKPKPFIIAHNHVNEGITYDKTKTNVLTIFDGILS